MSILQGLIHVYWQLFGSLAARPRHRYPRYQPLQTEYCGTYRSGQPSTDGTISAQHPTRISLEGCLTRASTCHLGHGIQTAGRFDDQGLRRPRRLVKSRSCHQTPQDQLRVQLHTMACVGRNGSASPVGLLSMAREQHMDMKRFSVCLHLETGRPAARAISGAR